MANSDFNPRVVALDAEAGDEIVSVLSSDTTRRIYRLVEERARTPKAIADELELSIQNVHYHLQKIQEVGLVEPNGIEYSEKGREMKIYEPVHDELIICSDQEARDRLDRLLRRLIDGTVIVAILAAFTHLLITRILGIGPGAVSTPLSGGDTGVASSEQIFSVPVWEYPAIWVLLIGLGVTVLYSVWRYRQDRPHC